MIKSRFSLSFYFYALPISGLFLLGLVFITHAEWQFKNKLGGTNSALLPGLILVVGVGGIAVVLLRKLVMVRIAPEQISLRTLFFWRTISRAEIRSIRILGSDDLTIRCMDDEVYGLNYGFYRNMPQLKRYLREQYSDLVLPPPNPKQGNADPPATRTIAGREESRVFDGNFFTSQNGIFIMGFLLLLIWALFTAWKELSVHPPMFLILLAPIAGIVGLAATQVYYFRLTGEVLEIRNHVWPWYRREYRLVEIDNVAFEAPFRRSHTLRVRTRNFESDAYGAGTLRKRNWHALYKALQERHISVSSQFGTSMRR
ncbi:MAG TPA: hypothetical protein VNW04_19410 [Puia sp.]|nr:hypothetical protein [Puia sp.]